MKALILILCAFVVGCYGYSYVIPASFKTPGICFYNGRILPKGDSQIPMVCQNTYCREDGLIKVDGCGRISLPNCTLIENISLTRPYPECCEMTYQCTDAEGSIYTKEWNQLNPNDSVVPNIPNNPDDDAPNSSDKPNNSGNGPILPPSGKNEKQHVYKVFSPFLLQLMLFV